MSAGASSYCEETGQRPRAIGQEPAVEPAIGHLLDLDEDHDLEQLAGKMLRRADRAWRHDEMARLPALANAISYWTLFADASLCAIHTRMLGTMNSLMMLG